MMSMLRTALFVTSLLILSYGAASAQDLDGVLRFFDDPELFNAVCPALSFEDFEPNVPGPDTLTFCSSPTINSQTNDECFSPGDLIDGFTVTTSDIITFPQPIMLITPPNFGYPVAAVGSNVDGDDTIVLFDGSVSAAGFLILPFLSDVDVEVQVFGEGDSFLGSTTVAVDAPPQGAFIGVISGTELITKIVLLDSGGNTFELIGNLSFGGCDLARPIPTLSEWGLIAMAGLIGIAGLWAVRRKRALA